VRVLLIYPIFPPSFWSFERTIELTGKKAMLPPLGLITVAALLPPEFECKLVDRNVREVSEAEWKWADIVMLSAMIVQKQDMLAQIREAKRRGKPVVVGGPYPTALPKHCQDAGADFLVLDEAEVTLPVFLEALERGDKTGMFRSGGEKPDVTHTPVPRFELLQLDAYAQMSVQFSRGCPFMCEFCDIIVLYGRKPRTKTAPQMLAELDRLYQLGWERAVFVVDDNFIGNKKNVKAFLHELRPWMVEHGYPFSFATESSVDLAHDQELMDLMRECNFGAVFLGIETPDPDSLALTRKTQNMRDPLAESVMRIARSRLRVMAGFIIGFDNEKAGAGRRIVDFVEETTVPTAVFSMLQALPDTALSKRLAAAGRLLGDECGGTAGEGGDINQTSLMNFLPTRPITQIADEYVNGFWRLYDPTRYLDRVFRHFMLLKEAKYPKKPQRLGSRKPSWENIHALLVILYRQGFVRETRFQFWRQLYRMWRVNPGGLSSYVSTCAHAEHLLEYRQRVRQMIADQLKQNLSAFDKVPNPPSAAPSERQHVDVTISAKSKPRSAIANEAPL
jgi:radical SAM superfamily enzyme YgiQ (UPF0313 family)